MSQEAEIMYYQKSKQILTTTSLEPGDFPVAIYSDLENRELLFWGTISLFISPGNEAVMHAVAREKGGTEDASKLTAHKDSSLDSNAGTLHDAKTLPSFERRGLSRLLRALLGHTAGLVYKKKKFISFIDEDNEPSLKAGLLTPMVAVPGELSTHLLFTEINLSGSKMHADRDIRILQVVKHLDVPSDEARQMEIFSTYAT